MTSATIPASEGVAAPDQEVDEGDQSRHRDDKADEKEWRRKNPSPNLVVISGHESVDSPKGHFQPHRRPLGPAALGGLAGRIEPLANVDPEVAWCIGQETSLAQRRHEVAHLLEAEGSELLEIVDDEVRHPPRAVHPLHQEIVPFADPEILSRPVGKHDVGLAVTGRHPSPGQVQAQDRDVAPKADVFSEAIPNRRLHRPAATAGAYGWSRSKSTASPEQVP